MRIDRLAAAVAVSIAASPVLAAGDAEIGAKLFLQCRACHTIAAGSPGGIGPNLRGVVGAKAGKRPGYSYSAAMSGSGITWDATTLDTFLTKPTALVPGTKMTFPGVAADKSRADIIAYLTTLK